MRKILTIIFLLLITFTVSARTYTVEIAFPEHSNPTYTLARAIIAKLNKCFIHTNITFQLIKATNGSNVILHPSVEDTWRDNVLIKNNAMYNPSIVVPDIVLIIKTTYTEDVIGMATYGALSDYFNFNSAIAVVSNVTASLLMHEVGHLFGLDHSYGNHAMNPAPLVSRFSERDLIYLSQF